MAIKTHTFRGKVFDVSFEGSTEGYCVAAHQKRGEVVLCEERPPKQFLETAIHEAMHALNWSIGEPIIEERARELARWLWRLGYRREE